MALVIGIHLQSGVTTCGAIYIAGDPQLIAKDHRNAHLHGSAEIQHAPLQFGEMMLHCN